MSATHAAVPIGTVVRDIAAHVLRASSAHGQAEHRFAGRYRLHRPMDVPLVATEAVRVYPGMEIGQMMWWTPVGEISCYTGKYQHSRGHRRAFRPARRTYRRWQYADSGGSAVAG